MGLHDRIHAQAQNDRHDAESQSKAQRAITAEMARQVEQIRADLAARDARRAEARRRLLQKD
jgi:hypothetical protein